jgi:hypothetical protein
MRKRKPSDHESIAHQYLKDGSPFGGRSALELIEGAALALEPDGEGIKGPGVAMPMISKAIELLVNAQVELGMSVGKRQAALAQKDKERAKRKKAKAR